GPRSLACGIESGADGRVRSSGKALTLLWPRGSCYRSRFRPLILLPEPVSRSGRAALPPTGATSGPSFGPRWGERHRYWRVRPPAGLTEAPSRGRQCYGAGSKGEWVSCPGGPPPVGGLATGRGVRRGVAPGGTSLRGWVVVPPTARGPEGAHACRPWPQCSAGSAGATVAFAG